MIHHPDTHPDTHPAAQRWSNDQILHVAACYSNPYRFRNRRELANDFRRHMCQSANVQLHFVELAYGDRPFEVAMDDAQLDIQIRTGHELFHKENLLNLAVRSFPRTWKYGAIIDADFHFTRHDWALETVHQLQHHAWVQLFSSYSDLTDTHRIVGTNNGFAYNYASNGYAVPASYQSCEYDYGGRKVGATGGAWGFRRESFDAVGGLLDRCILGHGDWFMAFGLAGAPAPDMRIAGYSPEYRAYIQSWQERATREVRKNIGYVDGHAVHHWHGPKGKRGYSTRDQILVEHQYNPHTDVHYDWQGALQLAPHRIELRDSIRRYFLSRNEDLPSENT